MGFETTSYSKSVVNNSVSPFGVSETFTGVGEFIGFSDVMVTCKADKSGTLYFDFSDTGIFSGEQSSFPPNGFVVSANIYEFHTAVKGPRYFRVRFVNDVVAQTSFRLSTYFGNFKQGNLPLNASKAIDADAIIVRPTSPQDEITRGLDSAATSWNKFAYRDNSVAASGEQIIWAATSDSFTVMESANNFKILYSNSADGASSTGGAKSLIFYYLNSNQLPAISIHSMGSSGTDVTSFTGVGINRIAVYSSGTLKSNSSDIYTYDSGGGSLQAVVPAGGSVTQQAIFHVASNHTAVTKLLYIHANKLSGSNPKVEFKGISYSRVTKTNYEIFRHTLDTSVENSLVLTDPVNFPLGAGDVLFVTMDTNTNDAESSCRFSLNLYRNL